MYVNMIIFIFQQVFTILESEYLGTVGFLKKVHYSFLTSWTCTHIVGQNCLKDLLRYPLAREGVYAPDGPAFLAHARQRVSNIVGLTALRLAFFMGYVYNKLVQWFLY